MGGMKVSLILATYGRAEELGRAVDSFLAQTDRSFELIIVDQNTDERLLPHVQKAQQGGLNVRHVRMDKPGLSAARNRGIALAQHEILAFPDDDCWYEPQVIEQVRRAFTADPTLRGAIGCWVEQAGPVAKPPYLLDYTAWRHFRGGHASSISLFFDRVLFQSLGGFDERFGVGQWYGAAEEIDFILRALGTGARLRYCPEVRVHHAYTSRALGNLGTICRQARQRSRGTGAIYAKHKLPVHVVIRGLLAPVATALPRLLPAQIGRGLFTSLGRIEGYLRWRSRES
jgi:glycosyltransferase involved in cell wall biosynthesis